MYFLNSSMREARLSTSDSNARRLMDTTQKGVFDLIYKTLDTPLGIKVSDSDRSLAVLCVAKGALNGLIYYLSGVEDVDGGNFFYGACKKLQGNLAQVSKTLQSL